jgi:hypothetical protein
LEATYFSLLDIIPVFFWVIVILVGALILRSSKSHLPEYKYYMPNLLMKMFFGVMFGLVYIFIYGGGDTTAYFDGAVAMNNLFFKSPSFFFEELFKTPQRGHYSTYFDSTTGFPPGWIYNEPEGFFISKIVSIFSFFTLKSYFAMTLIIATFTAHASWLIFKLVRSYNFCNEKLLAFGVLYLPSVNFWCSGVSKDSVVFIASLYLVYNLFKVISKELTSRLINFIMIVGMSFLIFHVRSFILVAIFIPVFFSISARLVKALGGGNLAVVTFRTLLLAIGIFSIGRSFILQSEEDFLASNSSLLEASVIQKDFQENTAYGNKKYDLGEVEFTSIGLLKVMPIAIITGIFRPFIWEALSPTLIMNGLESVIFLYFTYFFFRRNAMKKWKLIRGHEFLIFCLIFILIIGFMTGMTSVLYGVLVRLRAPLLPFLSVLLIVTPQLINSIEKK